MTSKQRWASGICLLLFVGGLSFQLRSSARVPRSSTTQSKVAVGILPHFEKRPPDAFSFGLGGGSPRVPVVTRAETQQAIHDLRQECEGVSIGQVAFASTRQMVEGISSQVQVRVTRGESPISLRDLPERQLEGAVVERSGLTCVVKATLLSASGAFDIQPGPEVQRERYLRADRAEEWQWLVTPLRKGKMDLTLTVQPELLVDGFGPTATAVQTFTHTVYVQVSYEYSARRYAGLGLTLFSGTALAGTLLPAVWSWGKKKIDMRPKKEPWAAP